MSERDWLGLELVEAPAADARAAPAGPRRRPTSTRSRSSRERGGGMIDLDTVASAGSWEAALHAAGGAAWRAAERLLGRRGRLRLLRPAAAGPPRRARPRDGLLPLQQRRGGRRARARRARGRAGPGPRLGRPPRQRHRGDLLRLRRRSSTRASTRARSIRGPGAATDVGSGEGEGYTVNLPVPPGSGRRRVPVAGPARGRADRPRVAARADLHLGRLRRPPRRPARELRAGRRGATGRWRRRSRAWPPSWARRCCLPRGRLLRSARSPRSVVATLEALPRRRAIRARLPPEPAAPYRERLARLLARARPDSRLRSGGQLLLELAEHGFGKPGTVSRSSMESKPSWRSR